MKGLLGALMGAVSLIDAAACRQLDPPKATEPIVDAAAQSVEHEFRWKERCSGAAEQWDRLFNPPAGASLSSGDVEMSVSEVFYSPVRNSCVCEVSAVTNERTRGLSNLLTLYDCLTRERLGATVLDFADPAVAQQRQDAWQRSKDAFKASALPPGVTVTQSP